jgi:hypothetical protein
MIWINQFRLTLAQPRVAQPHRKTTMQFLYAAIWTLFATCSISSRLAWSAEAPGPADPGPISYSTLDEALKDLHSKSGVTFRDESGWIVAEDLGASTVWLITPPGHPAYPSIVRRMLANGPNAHT